MSKLILILLALCPVVLKAQSSDKLRVKDVLPIKGPLYVVDGKKMSLEEFRLAPRGNVSAFITLSDSAGRAQYGAEGANGVVIVNTGNRTISSYKNRLMALSADYKAYLSSHSYDDKQFIYVLNEVQLLNDENRYDNLDNIPGDKIVSVTVMHDEPGIEKGLTRIHIITKK